MNNPADKKEPSQKTNLPPKGAERLPDGNPNHYAKPPEGFQAINRLGTSLFWSALGIEGLVIGFHGSRFKAKSSRKRKAEKRAKEKPGIVAPFEATKDYGQYEHYWWVMLSSDHSIVLVRWLPPCDRSWNTMEEVNADPELLAKYRALDHSVEKKKAKEE